MPKLITTILIYSAFIFVSFLTLKEINKSFKNNIPNSEEIMKSKKINFLYKNHFFRYLIHCKHSWLIRRIY